MSDASPCRGKARINPAASKQAGDNSDTGNPRPAPDANIFLAGAPPQGQGLFKWAVLSALLITASFPGLYYLAVSPLAETLPAAGSEIGMLPLPVVGPLRLDPGDRDAAALNPARPIPAAADNDRTPETGTARAASPKPAAAASSVAPAATDTDAHGPAPFEISRHQADDAVGRLLRQAFDAYHAAEYARAARLYREVLAQAPDNRDAHLGLGAIALGENNAADAYAHYARLLKLNPDDMLALNGLMALPGAAGLDERALARLPAKEAEAPLLYFSLGGVYARQSRWAEAAEAFRAAHGLAGRNPDYAFNLAVSLDHLGQYRAALNYYHKAMTLARANKAHFDPAAVKRRIATLEESGDP